MEERYARADRAYMAVKASELIRALQAIVDEHGDLDVEYDDDGRPMSPDPKFRAAPTHSRDGEPYPEGMIDDWIEL